MRHVARDRVLMAPDAPHQHHTTKQMATETLESLEKNFVTSGGLASKVQKFVFCKLRSVITNAHTYPVSKGGEGIKRGKISILPQMWLLVLHYTTLSIMIGYISIFLN